MSDADYLVLPISRLKAESSRIFGALAAGRMVYISKHGDIEAAFMPYEAIPESIAARYASPAQAPIGEVTARDLGRSVPSAAVSEAIDGLPSLLTKEGRIYGLLTAATPPAPSVIPDPAAAGARAEAVRQFLKEEPDADLDTIIAVDQGWTATLDKHAPLTVDAPDPPGGTALDTGLAEAVIEDLNRWRNHGSQIEPFVQLMLMRALELVNTSVTSQLGDVVSRAPVAAAVATASATAVVAPDDLTDRVTAAGCDEAALLRIGERFEDNDELVDARSTYVSALLIDSAPSSGAMWKLGELSRKAGLTAEAATWYHLAIENDRLSVRRHGAPPDEALVVWIDDAPAVTAPMLSGPEPAAATAGC